MISFQPLYTCKACMLRIYEQIQTMPLTLSIDGVLRDSENAPLRASADSSVEITGRELEEDSSHTSDESQQPLAQHSTDSIAIAQQTQNVPLSPVSEEFEFLRPLDPKLAEQFDAILAKPGPRSLKRRKIQELQNNNSESESSLEDSQDSEEIRKEREYQRTLAAKKQKAQEQRRSKTPGTTSNSVSSSSSSSKRLVSRSSEERLVNSSVNISPPSSQLVIRSPSVGPPKPSQPYRVHSILPPSIVPSSQSSVTSSDSGFRPPTPPNVSKRRKKNRSHDDGNSHSNGAAPRRINPAIHTGANNNRNIHAKNMGG